MWLKKHFNLLVIISVCILVLIYVNTKEDYVEEYNSKINQLEQKVDSLNSLNSGLTFKIDTLNTKILALDTELDLKDNKIITLRHEYKQKMGAVDSYSDDELKKFFTERYRHYLDSVAKEHSSSSH